MGIQCVIFDEITFQDIKEAPEDGVYVYGMFLEGARWDARKHYLSGSKPKELFSDLPLMLWKPIYNKVEEVVELTEEEQLLKEEAEREAEREREKQEKLLGKGQKKDVQKAKVVAQEKELIMYKTPLYKVVSRAGTLSTTGHSTNFVMFIDLPSKDDEEYWVRAGVAAFLSLRY